MITLVFVPPGHDDVELARCEKTEAAPRVGDDIFLSLIIPYNERLIEDPRKLVYAEFHVVSASWDLRNTHVTESWMPQREIYASGQDAYLYLRVTPMNKETRAYMERLMLTEEKTSEDIIKALDTPTTEGA